MSKPEFKTVAGTPYKVMKPSTPTNAQRRARAHNAKVAAHNAAQELLPIERRVMQQYVSVPKCETYVRVKPKLWRMSPVNAMRNLSKARKEHTKYLVTAQ